MSDLPQIFINPKDGYELILVPAGEAVFGSLEDEPDSDFDGKPQFRTFLPDFYLGKYPVRNREYLQFVLETGHRAPDLADWGEPVWHRHGFPEELGDHPVVCISWDDAQAYCEWAGLRLPTELEWEKAARGNDGAIFPWGNELDPNKCRHAGNRGHDQTCRVWEYPKGSSKWGHFQLAGNVWEWCTDWYEEQVYRRYAQGDLTPPESGLYRIMRGGSWNYFYQTLFRSTYRSIYNLSPDYRLVSHGFRCVRDANP